VSGNLDRRLAALADAVEVADGRLEPQIVDRARRVIARAGKRLGLGVEATVVALTGPTGGGKSTLFNALAGTELSQASRRRPTTASAAAAVWGEPSDTLLDWLQVPRRHRMEGGHADGLVLLDLPDFDSVEVGHRLEVDRLLELIDLVVWVVDPQKYADASFHDHYLRELADYAKTMVVVLNQSDLLEAWSRDACRVDLERLLRNDGLDGVPVFAISARTGDGLEDLRGVLERRVAARSAAVDRLAADVTATASVLAAGCSDQAAHGVRRGDRQRLVDSLTEAAGISTVTRAVALAHRRRGSLATGWPFLRWVRRLRPDPLRRLRLGPRPDPDSRSSLPGPTALQSAQAATAARSLANGAAAGLRAPWPSLVRRAATRTEHDLAERLERAVAGAHVDPSRPRWWRLVGVLQALLVATALAGGLWLLVLAVLGFLHLPDVLPLPKVEGIPLPTLLLGGALLAGMLVALIAGACNRIGARRRTLTAAASIRRRVEEVANRLVIEPVEAELAAHDRLCAATSEALAPAGRLRSLGRRGLAPAGGGS
jgi:GTP-binding protein EngB required for normal cell division